MYVRKNLYMVVKLLLQTEIIMIGKKNIESEKSMKNTYIPTACHEKSMKNAHIAFAWHEKSMKNAYIAPACHEKDVLFFETNSLG